MKFTFKTEKWEGKWKSFHAPYHYIKLKKMQVGSIDDMPPYSVRLMVVKKDINEDGNNNCEWKWIKLANKSNSLQEAKDWLNENAEKIINKFTLKQMEL